MTIRVCPERDAICPHGMDCEFTIDRYRCDMDASRAALKSPDRPDYVQGRPIEEMARAMFECEWAHLKGPVKERRWELLADVYRPQARAALDVLVKHGWIDITGLRAIHLEEAKNGETGE